MYGTNNIKFSTAFTAQRALIRASDHPSSSMTNVSLWIQRAEFSWGTDKVS
jgi:hypothetical protein